MKRAYLATAILMTLLAVAAIVAFIVLGYLGIAQQSDALASATAFTVLPIFIFGVPAAFLWAAVLP